MNKRNLAVKIGELPYRVQTLDSDSLSKIFGGDGSCQPDGTDCDCQPPGFCCHICYVSDFFGTKCVP
jgi:hypothetical protein